MHLYLWHARGVEMMKKQNAGAPTQEDRKFKEEDCKGDGPFAVIPSMG